MKVVALAGGVGGARLSHGLFFNQPELKIIVNTGDDFHLHGLTLCPDLDTVLYTLAGWAHFEQGWGLQGDSNHCNEQLRKLGGQAWYFLGDRDLATHLFRTQRISEGAGLSEITKQLCQAAGLPPLLLPMSDQPAPTRLRCEQGWLDFQEYFVKRAQQDRVLQIDSPLTPLLPEAGQALQEADRIILAPSNPFLSLFPILTREGLSPIWTASSARKVGVSPMLGNQAVKGPLASLLGSLGHPVSSLGIAQLLQNWIDVLIIDEQDRALAEPIRDLGLEVVLAPTWMKSLEDRKQLAQLALHV